MNSGQGWLDVRAEKVQHRKETEWWPEQVSTFSLESENILMPQVRDRNN